MTTDNKYYYQLNKTILQAFEHVLQVMKMMKMADTWTIHTE